MGAAEPAANSPSLAKGESVSGPASPPDGRELFTREWLVNDSRAHGGDGLGPVYNDSSCIACHNQGGVGGGGAASKNVDILTAVSVASSPQIVVARPAQQPSLAASLLNAALGGSALPAAHEQKIVQAKPQSPEELQAAKKKDKEALVKIHPGFAASRSVVVHRFSADSKYEEWRTRMLSGQLVAQMAGSGPVAIPPVDANGLSQNVNLSGNAAPNAAEAKPAKREATVSPPSQATAPTATFAITSAFTVVAPAVGPQSGPFPEMVRLKSEVRRSAIGFIGMATQLGTIRISRSQRNPTALFGVGQIDAIPEAAIIERAKLEWEKHADVAGRPAKLKDGKIGRFGWKDQTASLKDFALTACAVELGLNVPGHEQAGTPLKPDYKAPGLDMNEAECTALVNFLRDLPTPVARKPANAQEAETIEAGRQQFAAVGCAVCHTQKLGPVDGLYSDLLLHDMGPELGDAGSYVPDAPDDELDEKPSAGKPGRIPLAAAPKGKPTLEQLGKVVGALRQEWRTPPLWGVRDSGPYLHDGRAATLEQAIALHGGQAATAAMKFFVLEPEERQQLIVFLKSLTAPDQTVAMK